MPAGRQRSATGSPGVFKGHSVNESTCMGDELDGPMLIQSGKGWFVVQMFLQMF